MSNSTTKKTNQAAQNLFDDGANLGEYIAIILKHKWFILFLIISFVSIAYFIVSNMKPVFQSSASILLNTQKSQVTSIQEIYGVDKQNTQYYNTQIDILRSRNMALMVINKMDLFHNPKFNTYLNPEESLLKKIKKHILPADWIKKSSPLTKQQINKLLLKKFQKQLTIKTNTKSQLIEILFESTSAKLTSQVAMSIINNYISQEFNNTRQMNQSAVGWLTEKLNGLKKNLEQSEKKLFDYRKKSNLLDVEGVQTISARKLDDTSRKLSEARKKRIELDVIYQQIRDINIPSIQQYESIPGILDNTTLQRAKETAEQDYSRVIELSKRYGAKHSKMQSALANYKKSRMNHSKVLKNLVRGIEKQYLMAVAYEKTLNQDLYRDKKEIRSINQKSYTLKDLEREVAANKQLYETFLTRFKETSEVSGMKTATAKVIDSAVTPEKPFKPKKLPILLLAFVFSIIIGVVYAFIIEALNKTFQYPAQIEQKLKLPLLGVLPKLHLKKKEKSSLFIPFLSPRHKQYAESLRTIRTGLLLSVMDTDNKITLVTSSVPSEGKTTTALNLAIALGQSEKVLLIDGDLRKPVLAGRCDIQSDFGVTTLVNKESDIENSIHRFEKWNIDILPAGKHHPNPQEIYVTKAFHQLLDQLKNHYDRIIIDSAPVLAVADSLLLSKLADNIVFVVQADGTNELQARSSLDRLKQCNAEITGIILNQFNLKNASTYQGNDYYSGYYSNYEYN
jgi:polysaccharide biosynthesis transport protein